MTKSALIQRLISLDSRVGSVHPSAALFATDESFNAADFTLPNDVISEDALRVVKRLGQGDNKIEEGDIVSAIEVLRKRV